MERMIDIAGHPTWMEEQGEGDPVLVLHGGISSSEDLGPLIDALVPHFRVVAFDRRGHGRTADTEEPFSYAAMADEASAVLDAVVGGPAHLVGYSDGGITALHVALARPELVRSMVLIGTNFRADALLPAMFDLTPDNPMMAMIAQSYAARSPDGPEHFPVFFEKSAAMWRTQPNLSAEDLAAIPARTLVLAGDDEPMPLSHTVALYEGLPDARLAVIPGASHIVVYEQPDLVHRLILEFLTSEGSPQTLWPVRRA
jgi:pimeloyl-ACP methyl ester carboxylesterase